MIIIYTGDGKGKTSACVGQALRALGQGMTVAFGQFIKKPDVAGEQRMLARLPNCQFKAGGLGFCLHDIDKELHRQKARELLNWAKSAQSDMLILDEALYAVSFGMLTLAEVQELARNFDGSARHLVLSGRYTNLSQLAFADIVTEMREFRHPHRLGIGPQKGIEF